MDGAYLTFSRTRTICITKGTSNNGHFSPKPYVCIFAEVKQKSAAAGILCSPERQRCAQCELNMEKAKFLKLN